MAWDEYTKLMLHFNGADASTTFTDEIGHIFTANGNAQLDTAQKKFGTASGLFDGTGDWIDTPDHADFTLSSGEFTEDFWVRRAGIDSRQLICGQGNDGGGYVAIWVEFRVDNTVRAVMMKNDDTTPYSIISTGTITDSNWHHIAFVRDNTGTDTLRLFIDGSVDGTVSCDDIIAADSIYKFSIGRLGEYNGLYFNGWIDEFRLSVGIARWTSNFTPPTAEYEEEAAFIPHQGYYPKILAH